MELKEKNMEQKIKKLLALADNNPSEAEASSALLKAQQLMAEYNISLDSVSMEADIKYATEICTHKWDMGFRKPLGHVIANNFRCMMFIQSGKIAFMGHENDAKIAREAFEYAYEFILREANKAYNRAYQMDAPTKGVFNSYTMGFIAGLKEKLDTQCTSLMIVTPPDVKVEFETMTAGWKSKSSKVQLNPWELNRAVYEQGKSEGKTALDSRRIGKA